LIGVNFNSPDDRKLGQLLTWINQSTHIEAESRYWRGS